MAYYNTQTRSNNGATLGVALSGTKTAKALYNAPWATSLSGSTFTVTYTNTAGAGISSGSGILTVDGVYQARRATGTAALVSGGANPYTAGVSAVTITYAGVGYEADAQVSFTSPASGTNVATGTVTVVAGSARQVTITNPGSGYAVAPTVTFSVPPESNMFIQMADVTSFKFIVPNVAASSTTAVTLTSVGYHAQSPTQIRLRNQGQI